MTWFDGVIIGAVALSGLLAMARGMVHEAFSLAGWLLAAILTFIALKQGVSFPVRRLLGSVLIADIGTGILIFLAVLVVFSLLTGWIVRRLPEGRFGFLDRLLGLAFGLARGVLLVLLVYVLLLQVFDERKNTMPRAIKDGVTNRYLKQGSEILLEKGGDWLAWARRQIDTQLKKAPQ